MPSGVAIVGNRSNEVGPKNQGADKEIAILRGNHKPKERSRGRTEKRDKTEKTRKTLRGYQCLYGAEAPISLSTKEPNRRA